MEQTHCHICGNKVTDPWRVYDDNGKVIEGCVDASHTGHLVTPSESASWHNRPEAKAIRNLLKRGNYTDKRRTIKIE